MLQPATVFVPPPLAVPGPVLVSFAVVALTRKVPQGHLVELREPDWHAAVAALQRDPSGRFQIPPREFEALIAGLYKAAGFDEVILTPSSGDFGIDVVATKWGDYGYKVLGQVKRYAHDHLVKAEEVRSFVFALDRDKSASRGIVTTTSDFAPGVPHEFKEWVPTRVDLVNGTRLLDMLANPKRR